MSETRDESAVLAEYLLHLHDQSSKDDQHAREHSARVLQSLKETLHGEKVS